MASVTSGTANMRMNITDGGVLDYLSPEITVNTVPTRYTFKQTFPGTVGNNVNYAGIYNSQTSPNSATFILTNFMLEDVTGQTNQNPSEYVSVGVLSAPYHGANVDGVQYFTTQNGNTVASNVVTEAIGAAIPDATLHGYLAEGARTNLLTYSEQFDHWTLSDTTASVDSIVSPAGTLTADLMTAGTGGSSLIQTSANISVAGSTNTVSLYAKRGNNDWLEILLGTSNAANAFKAWFNVNTGVMGTTGVNGTGTFTRGSVTSVGNGWYRLQITGIIDSASTNGYLFIVATPADNNSSRVNGATYSLWGAQLETDAYGSFASSYIPTTTAAVTRNADVLSYPASGNVDGTKGSAYAQNIFSESLPSNYGSSSGILEAGGTGASGRYIYNLHDNAYMRNYDGTNGLDSNVMSPSISIGSLVKTAVKWSGNSKGMTVNGNSVKTGAFTGDMNVGTNITVGKVGSFYAPFGTIRNVRIWKKALTDTQLQNMTSTTTAISQSAVAKTTIKATGITKINVSQNGKLTDGLVGLWSFNGQDVSGTTAYDRSGQGHNATLVNSPAPTQGKSGQALSFNGTNQSATIGAVYNGVKTVSFWVKPGTTTQSIIDLNATATVDINAGTVRGNTFSTPTIYIDGAPMNTITNTDWHHIVITTDTGINATSMTLGTIAGTYFAGTLDEVRLYNRALFGKRSLGALQPGSERLPVRLLVHPRRRPERLRHRPRGHPMLDGKQPQSRHQNKRYKQSNQ